MMINISVVVLRLVAPQQKSACLKMKWNTVKNAKIFLLLQQGKFMVATVEAALLRISAGNHACAGWPYGIRVPIYASVCMRAKPK